jgi:hypothetical protein
MLLQHLLTEGRNDVSDGRQSQQINRHIGQFVRELFQYFLRFQGTIVVVVVVVSLPLQQLGQFPHFSKQGQNQVARRMIFIPIAVHGKLPRFLGQIWQRLDQLGQGNGSGALWMVVVGVIPCRLIRLGYSGNVTILRVLSSLALQ